MARKVLNRSFDNKLTRTWWGRALLAAIALAAAYGFASWAIDSGNLLHYAIAIGLVWWAFSSLIKSARQAFSG